MNEWMHECMNEWQWRWGNVPLLFIRWIFVNNVQHDFIILLCKINYFEFDEDHDDSFSTWFWIQPNLWTRVLYDELIIEFDACCLVLFANFLGPPVWENLVITKSVVIKNIGPNNNKLLLGKSLVVMMNEWLVIIMSYCMGWLMRFGVCRRMDCLYGGRYNLEIFSLDLNYLMSYKQDE